MSSLTYVVRCNFVLAAVNVVVAVVVASAAVGFMQIVGQLWWQRRNVLGMHFGYF